MTERAELESLAPCPFCGGRAEHRPELGLRSPGYWVRCTVCNAQSDDRNTPEGAANKWNARTASPAADREEVARIANGITAKAFEVLQGNATVDDVQKSVFDAILSLRATTPGGDVPRDSVRLLEWLDGIAENGKPGYRAPLNSIIMGIAAENFAAELRASATPGAVAEPVAWLYEYNDIHDYWRPGIILNIPVAKNPPTSHHGNPVRNVRAVYTHHAPSDGAIREALSGLRNEIRGVLSLGEEAIREAVSSTNVNCLLHWIEKADAALAAQSPATGKGE